MITYPILLIHGIYARDQGIDRSEVWGRIPERLRAQGFSVWFANQDAFGSVGGNARQIAQSLAQVLKSTGADKVHFVAHSKGGIDARRALALPEVAAHSASLTTLASPHRGLRYCNVLAKVPFVVPRLVVPALARWALWRGDVDPQPLQALHDLTTNGIGAATDDAADDFDGKSTSRANAIFDTCDTLSSTDSSSDMIAASDFPICSVAFKRNRYDALRNWRPAGILVRIFDGENDGIVPLASTEFGDWIVVRVAKGQRFDHLDATDMRKRDITLELPEGTSLKSPADLVMYLIELHESSAESLP